MHGWSYDGHMGWMNGTGWMLIWWVLGAALTAAVIWSIVKSTRGSTTGRRETPEETLKRRYAKGEIDRETYQQTLKELKS